MRKIFILVFFGMITCPGICNAAHKEARAVWLSRFEYTPHGYSPDYQKAYLRQAIENLKQAHFNMLIFQVRGQADAFYRSNYEPWSDRLTGTLGKDPGWDPLEYVIDLAHKNSIALHAWINVYPCWKGNSPPPESTPEHLYLKHPEWICCDPQGVPMPVDGEAYASLSPGIPEVREYLINICLDIVLNYDIDGLHFDYIRYPNRQYSHDPISDFLFSDPIIGNPEGLSREAWQREQVNKFVREVYDVVTEINPMLKVSAAVIGKYNYPSVSWDGYNACYQDGRQWTAEGKIDFLAPMMYWLIGQTSPWAPFEILARNWVFDNANGRHIYGGIGAYKNTDNFPEIAAEIDTLRKIRAQGEVFFSYGTLRNSDFWDDLLAWHYKNLANVPPMFWKDSIPPEKPVDLIAKWITPMTIELTWQPPPEASDGDVAGYYNIYRSAGRSPIDLEDPKHLYVITPNNQTHFVDADLDSNKNYYYWVSALDDADNEGPVTGVKKATAVQEIPIADMPIDFELRPNYPNPFNSQTTIEYSIPRVMDNEQVTLIIYNMLGRKIRTLVNRAHPVGQYTIIWDGKNDSGLEVTTGMYVYRLQCKGYNLSRKMLLLQ